MFSIRTPEYTTHKNWSNSAVKRVFDAATAAIALFFLSPLMVFIALLVKFTSEGPVLFRQTRMGKHGHAFEILKFRSMHVMHNGPNVTRAGDSRLTPIGGFLRRFKLDELPQLINVMRGDMSLVGPRPKVPHHQTYTLRVRPGVTGAASLAFRDEEYFLHHVPEHALDACQVEVLMPLKRELDDEYIRTATFLSDIGILVRTVLGLRPEVHAERVGNLQVSLISLSKALGPSVTPAQVRAQGAASKAMVSEIA